MGEALEKLSGKLGVDTTDFKTNIAAANRELRLLESGFKSNVASLEEWSKTSTGVEARIAALTGKIEVQSLKVAALRENFERIKTEQGANSRAAKEAEIALNKETETLGKMELELKNTDSALKKLNASQQNAGNNAAASGSKFSSFVASAKEAVGSIGLAIGAVTAAFYTVNKVLDATIGTMVEYADQVRRLSSATGESAEDSSRLIQVMDDLKISYEDIEKAVAKNGKTYDYSVEGLARMADEYINLTNEQDRAAFMQERFGKSWITFVPAMERGGQALREANAAVSENLILTEEALAQARQYEIAVDNLNDTFTGLKISIGTQAVPAMNTFLTALQKQIETGIEWQDAFPVFAIYDWAVELKNADAAVKASTQSLENQTQALENNGQSAEDNAAALKLVSDQNKELLGLVGQIQNAETSYQQSVKTLADERIEIEKKRAEEIAKGWDASEEKIKEYDNALLENSAKSAENAAQHDLDSKKIILGLLEQRLAQDGLTTVELDYLLQKGQAWGIYSAEVVTEAQKAMAEVGALANEVENIPENKTVTITVQQLGGYDIGTAQYDNIAHPGRASGGPVNAGRTYIVGERGPELFTPDESGFIIPNGAELGISNMANQFQSQMRSLESVLQGNTSFAKNSSSITLGDIIVNVPGTSATPQQIGAAVQDGLLKSLRAVGAV